MRICSRFKSLLAACLMLPLVAGAAPAAEEKEVTSSVISFTYDAPHRDRLVQATIWYPALKGGYPESIGDNPVFRGVPAFRDARPDGVRHPLIVFSHGSGGNPSNLAWIAKRLASEGYVVALPTHQGSTSADSKPETTLLVWERTADVRVLLDKLAASPAMSRMIDSSDITVMGFSLGGHTALALSGARAVSSDYARFCDQNPASMDCVWFARGNRMIPGTLDLWKIDAARFGADQSDPRIKRFVAIDPAMAQAYDPASLAVMKVPGLVLNLGAGNDVAATVKPDRMKAATPPAIAYESVDGANHFSFLATCKPLGALWIWLEGDDPVCQERGSRTREELHQDIAGRIIAFLKRTSVAIN
ncbi:MAG: alpha/beta fold hydrolase [Proteobacteria bacterium]|nr:alpha/beta fold hydrolase [Pseudomonadota bacterium]